MKPLLTTARLELWQPQASDFAGLNALNTDPRTLEFLGNWSPGEADSFARLLFRMSSPLPPKLLDAARADGFDLVPGTRGFVFNADLVGVIRFLDIGTKVAQNLR